MYSKKNHITSHPLIKLILNNLKPLLQSSSNHLNKIAKKGDIRRKDKNELWEHEWYDYDVFTHASNITSGFERLQHSNIFINTFPQPRYFEKKRISQYTWITYHYSYYVITLVSLYDISLILTNSVLRLGNQEQDCKQPIIKNNKWVKNTAVDSSLTKINNLIIPHREGRNKHVHRGQVQDIASVMKSDDLDQLALFSFVQILGEPVVDKKIIDFAYKGEIKEINKRLYKEVAELHAVLWIFFDSLYPIYKANSIALYKKYNIILNSNK